MFNYERKDKMRKHEENTRNIELNCVSKTRYNWDFYNSVQFYGNETLLIAQCCSNSTLVHVFWKVFHAKWKTTCKREERGRILV